VVSYFLGFDYMYKKFFTIICTLAVCLFSSAFSVVFSLANNNTAIAFSAPSLGSIKEFTIVEKNNKKGLFDKEGNMILPIAFDDLGWSKGMPNVMDEKVIGYREGNLWGLISLKNKKITPPLYTSMEPLEEEYIIASKRSSTSVGLVYGIIDAKGKEILDFRYHSLLHTGEQFVASVLHNVSPVFGVIDESGTAVIGFNYASIVPLSTKVYAIKDETGKVALFRHTGTPLTTFAYDSISKFQNGIAILLVNGKKGVIREDGVILVQPEYGKIKINADHTVNALPFDTWHMLNGENEEMRTLQYDSIAPAGKNILKVFIDDDVETYVNTRGELLISDQWKIHALTGEYAILKNQGKYGVMALRSAGTHDVILEPVYDSVCIDQSFIITSKRIGKSSGQIWSLFDQEGRKLTYNSYQDIRRNKEGLFAVKRKNHWGYINTEGEEIIPCQYVAASDFKQGKARVDFIDGQGIIDTEGRWLVKPFKHRREKLQLEYIHDDLYIFQTEGQYSPTMYGLIDSSGKEVYNSHAQLIDNGNSVWEKDSFGRYGLIAYDGQRMLPTQYDTISALHEDTVYTFFGEGKYGILGKSGNKLIGHENDFQELHPMYDEYLGVKINDKFGFVDALGRLRIANRYDSITRYNNGLAAIKLIGKWGYIDKHERLIVQPHFEKAFPFNSKLAIVRKDGKYGLVNRSGETVLPLEYDTVYRARNHRYAVTKARTPGTRPSVGLVDEKGYLLIYPKYDAIEDLGNGYVIIHRGDEYGLVTIQGENTIPLKYDYLQYDPYNDVYLALEKARWETIDLSKYLSEGN